jgi:hypothetical protein
MTVIHFKDDDDDERCLEVFRQGRRRVGYFRVFIGVRHRHFAATLDSVKNDAWID